MTRQGRAEARLGRVRHALRENSFMLPHCRSVKNSAMLRERCIYPTLSLHRACRQTGYHEALAEHIDDDYGNRHQ